MSNSTQSKGRYWIGTINQGHGTWGPPQTLPDGCIWLKGQQEQGSTTNNLHWQLFAAFNKNVRRSFVTNSIGPGHWELSRSQAAETYVWKEQTRVADTQFELGSRALKRNSKTDWNKHWELAKSGRLEEMDGDVKIRFYSTLKRIAFDYSKPPVELDNVCGIWIWGEPGIGKSRRARDEYPNLFSKNLNKWWDGYNGEEHVLLDDVSLSHSSWIGWFLKIWADRYPFQAEIKGGTLNIRPKTLVVTSNYSIETLFPIDIQLQQAILRRFKVIHMIDPWTTIIENRNNQ